MNDLRAIEPHRMLIGPRRNPRTIRAMRYAAVLACLLISTPAVALQNPGFDSDLSSWTNPFDRPVAWDPVDASGDPGSGSANVGNPIVPGNGGALVILAQCVAANPNQGYRFGGLAQLLPDSVGLAAAGLIANTHSSPDCSGAPVQSHFGSFIFGTTWEPVEGLVPAAPETASIRLWLTVSKSTGVNVTTFARFDDLFLVEAPLFTDGFESP